MNQSVKQKILNRKSIHFLIKCYSNGRILYMSFCSSLIQPSIMFLFVFPRNIYGTIDWKTILHNFISVLVPSVPKWSKSPNFQHLTIFNYVKTMRKNCQSTIVALNLDGTWWIFPLNTWFWRYISHSSSLTSKKR